VQRPPSITTAQRRGGLAWSERYIETVQRRTKTLTPCFEVGFLTSPAVEESLDLQTCRKCAERQRIPAGEKSLCHQSICEIGVNALYINANFAVTSDRVESDLVGMGQVEMELACLGVAEEKGLSTWGGAKLQLLRLSTQVTGKYSPQ
jgi:hypothetical protein